MGPGCYDVIPPLESGNKSMVKYEFSSKKTESRLPSREAEGPGPGEYNVIKPLIKPTFNQGKWKPKLPTESKPSSSSFSKASIKAKRDTTVRSTSGDDIISVSEQIPNVSSRVVNGPPSHRKEQTSSNNSRILRLFGFLF